MVQAPQQSGSSLVVDTERDAFLQLLKKSEKPLVLHVHSGFPKTHKYFTSYDGFCFMVKSKAPQDFTMHAEVLSVNKVFTPSPGMGL